MVGVHARRETLVGFADGVHPPFSHERGQGKTHQENNQHNFLMRTLQNNPPAFQDKRFILLNTHGGRQR
jgi:hypothetical protein